MVVKTHHYMQDFFTKALNEKIISISPVSGGDINDAFKIVTESNTFFAKVNSDPVSKDMFEKEALGLELLKDKAQISVPEVISTGIIDRKSYLILNWIDKGKFTAINNESIARQLAILHKTSNDYFGLNYDNYIGTLHQKNIRNKDWLEFYFSNRIEYQLRLAIDSNLMQKSYIKKVELMFSRLEPDYPITSPALLHGDLWSGNFMVDDKNQAVFIDPAIYYGNREMDIAMMKLFGGFESDVFKIYDQIFPLEHLWQSRVKFHQLYYILVHVNLLGGGYVNSAENIIDYYV